MNSYMPGAPTKEVQLYARGRASRYGRTDGHWACDLLYGRFNYKYLSGNDPSHSKRRLELMGIIEGLKALKFPCLVRLKTADEYISDCGVRLLLPKSSDLWVQSVHKGSAKNSDLWQQIEQMKKIHGIVISQEKVGVMRCEADSARYWASHGPFIRPA
jgi:ribonuclease HI